MFHSVGLRRLRWVYPYIADPVECFDAFMAALRRRHYTSVLFKDHRPDTLHHRKEVVLTFDDGYLDNWVHVLPTLRKYAFTGTVFVNPEFVDPRDIVRPQVDEHMPLSDAAHDSERCCAGFLSWAELREMERSGIMDVQSHSLSHTWYFSGPRIVDFWHPGAATEESGAVWMLWNRFPAVKPFYLTQAAAWEGRIPYGTPIYEHGKALVTRRYWPHPALDEVLPEFVEANGGTRFFDDPSWRHRLDAAVAAAQRSGPGTGTLETEHDYIARVRYELAASKRFIEDQLGKRVNSVCWPGGGVTEQVLAIARDVGYERFTLPSAWAGARAQGEYRDLCPRMGGGSIIRHRARDLDTLRPAEFIWRVERMSGSRYYTALNRCSVLARRIQQHLADGQATAMRLAGSVPAQDR